MEEEDDDDLERALALSREEAAMDVADGGATAAAAPLAADTVVLGQIPAPFMVSAAAAARRTDIEATGKILLPASCLSVFISFLGEMPATLLLRMVGGDGSSCIVGVAEFVDDGQAAALFALAAGPHAREQPPPRLFERGPLAVAFVPRWVRAALFLDPMRPEAKLQIVSLPLASHMVLRPHTEAFSAALSLQGDVRETLTGLMNRYPAVSRGATLSLMLDKTMYQVDVLAIKALRHVRCGAAEDASARGGGGDEPSPGSRWRRGGGMGEGASSGSELVPAACIVDADVEVDFAPSVESETAASQAAVQAEAARTAKARQDAERAAAAAETTAAAERAAQAVGAERQRAALAALAALAAAPGNPLADDERQISCAVRLPDGARHTFSLSSGAPLAALWWSLESSGDIHRLPAEFALCTSFPRKRFVRPDNAAGAASTLASSGLADSMQQAFFIEPVTRSQ
jgi:hypothetical protein